MKGFIFIIGGARSGKSRYAVERAKELSARGRSPPSSAIASVITRRPVEDTTGKGTGVNEQILNDKIGLIKEAIHINMPDPEDAIDILSKVGGFEIGGIAGIILAAAKNRIPMVIDGFISGAASLIAFQLEPKVKDFSKGGIASAEIPEPEGADLGRSLLYFPLIGLFIGLMASLTASLLGFLPSLVKAAFIILEKQVLSF